MTLLAPPANAGSGLDGAAEGPAAARHDALARISDGDEAWWTGHRGEATRAWRAALELSRDGMEPRDAAAELLARLRLLHVDGSIAPFVHERALYEALDACPVREPWCVVARADMELWLPTFVGADPSRVPDLLADSPLVGPAAARVAVATGDRTRLEAVTDEDLDGMGRGIRTSGRLWPQAPGTWVVTGGVGGAPGAGFGAFARFVHPDLGWEAHRLELTGAADTLGGYAAAASLRTSWEVPVFAAVSAARSRAYVWHDGSPRRYTISGVRGAFAVSTREGPLWLSFGAAGRTERLEDVTLDGQASDTPLDVATAGPTLAIGVGDLTGASCARGPCVGGRASVEGAFGGYDLVAGTLDLRAHPRVGRGRLALRGLASGVASADGADPDPPFHRLATAGGNELLRGVPSGRFRDVLLLAVQTEARHPIVGPLEGAVFTDVASVEGLHWTAGGGLRLVLPPGRENVTRLDVGAGPDGWGVVVAYGEAL